MCIDICLPKYKRAFECLKSVNPKIKFFSVGSYNSTNATLDVSLYKIIWFIYVTHMFQKFNAIVKRWKRLIKYIHAFIDLATDVEIDVKSLKIYHGFDVVSLLKLA
jgi:hypothetical protein